MSTVATSALHALALVSAGAMLPLIRIRRRPKVRLLSQDWALQIEYARRPLYQRLCRARTKDDAHRFRLLNLARNQLRNRD